MYSRGDDIKRENILRNLKEQIECENDNANNLLTLSKARWTVRAVCFTTILDNYTVLWNVWKHCLQNDQMKTELKSRIIGVKTQMEYFHLFFGLNLGHRIFSHTDKQSKTLQAKKISACNSKRLAELNIQVLQNMRYQHSFNSFYDTAAKKSTECEFVKDPSTRERENRQIILLFFSLMVPLGKHKTFTQPHIKIAIK